MMPQQATLLRKSKSSVEIHANEQIERAEAFVQLAEKKL